MSRPRPKSSPPSTSPPNRRSFSRCLGFGQATSTPAISWRTLRPGAETSDSVTSGANAAQGFTEATRKGKGKGKVRKILVIRKARGQSRRGGGMDAWYCSLSESAVPTGSTSRDFRFYVIRFVSEHTPKGQHAQAILTRTRLLRPSNKGKRKLE
ncbi:uncharacterized protein LOC121969889 isoform X2 [Zingiber officinale]|uniref:uncharacterized protein LOC121969889 isoform X2 n=1 Tax=Zingiber officinale TaxID=94328 RepID=UPI001C4C105B|nr:uncharacterized protein LOC121969889 isoform X2 [Zingiber officinale]